MFRDRKLPRHTRRTPISLALALSLAMLAMLWRTQLAHAGEVDCGLGSDPSTDCPADYGDLPAPVAPSYGNTLLADDGARHIFIADDVILGALRDADGNGHEDFAAVGDDFTDADDEDGVVMTGVWKAGATGGQVSITASGAGCLTAWLDHFPADFDFDDPGEKIFDNQLIAAGTQTYSFPLMGTPAVGQNLYGRFRLVPAVDGSCDAAQTVGVTGVAMGGEVEDYMWNYTPTAIRLQAADTATAALPYWLLLTAAGLTLASTAVLRRRVVRVEAGEPLRRFDQ